MSHHLEEDSSFASEIRENNYVASEIRENNYVNAGNAEQFDVVVVGRGPSGSTMAAVTALRGRRTLVLESDRVLQVRGRELVQQVVQDRESRSFSSRRREAGRRWCRRPRSRTAASARPPRGATPRTALPSIP